MQLPIRSTLVAESPTNQKSFLKYNFLGLIWMVVLAVLMLTPSEHIPDSKLFSYDKIGHLLVFGILFTLLNLGFRNQDQFDLIKNKARIIALTTSIVYSALLEFLQKFVPGRAFDFYDILANTTGIFAGLIFFSVFSKK